ncbi:hypothetical protein AN641_06260 [Candidatus Epulonipiscioides gigas]|nr:hypothetical protein AN641_06260 [Epulopiscium sp. SCG-C07WGA-EpuloA2]
MSSISASGLSFSGLASGMDTDAMITAMVATYKSKYDNEQKEKLLMELKLEKYREVNTKVVDFYDDQIRKLRLQSTFSASETSTSNPNIVDVTGGGKTGDQITVEQLAKPIVIQTGRIGSTTMDKTTHLIKDLGFSHLDGFRFTDNDGIETDIKFTTAKFHYRDKTAISQSSPKTDSSGYYINNDTSRIEYDFNNLPNDSANPGPVFARHERIETIADLENAFNEKGIDINFDEETGQFNFSDINDKGISKYTITALKGEPKDFDKNDHKTYEITYEEVKDNTATTEVNELTDATTKLLDKIGVISKTDWETEERKTPATDATMSSIGLGATYKLTIGATEHEFNGSANIRTTLDKFGIEFDQDTGEPDFSGMTGDMTPIKLEKKNADDANFTPLSYNDTQMALSKMGIQDGYILTSSQYVSSPLAQEGVTSKTTMHELGATGSLEITIDGSSHYIKLSPTDTIEKLVNTLNDIGLDATFVESAGAFSILTDAETLSITESDAGTLSKLGIRAPESEKDDKIILGDGDNATKFTDLGFEPGDRIDIYDGPYSKPLTFHIGFNVQAPNEPLQCVDTVQDMLEYNIPAIDGKKIFDFNEDTNSFALLDEIDYTIKIRSAEMLSIEWYQKYPDKTEREQKEAEYALERLESLGIERNLVDSDGDDIKDKFVYETYPVGSKTYEYVGQKAKATYNGMEIESDTNVFKLDGITFVAKDVTKDGEVISVDKTINEEELFTTIEGFVNAYNTLIEELNTMTDVKYKKEDRDYKPLLSEEKEGMSEDDIELWNKKIDSLLLKDDPKIEGLLDRMRDTLMQVFREFDGFQSLNDIGIEASTAYTEKGKLVLNEEKLKESITKDSEGIMKLFVGDSEKDIDGYAEQLYDNVTDLLKGTTSSSSMFLFNDLELEKSILTQNEEIKKAKETMESKEEIYQAQFLAMEMAMQKMNSQSSLFANNTGGI